MNWVSALLTNNWVIAGVFLYLGYQAGRRANKIREERLINEWTEKVDSVFELLDIARVALGTRQVDKTFNGWVDENGDLDKRRIMGTKKTKA